MPFIADTDTDRRQLFWNSFFRSRCRDSCSLGDRIADKNDFGNAFYFIADTGTEKYYFRINSAMNSDKRYRLLHLENWVIQCLLQSGIPELSGPLNRLNAILSLLQPHRPL